MSYRRDEFTAEELANRRTSKADLLEALEDVREATRRAKEILELVLDPGARTRRGYTRRALLRKVLELLEWLADRLSSLDEVQS